MTMLLSGSGMSSLESGRYHLEILYKQSCSEGIDWANIRCIEAEDLYETLLHIEIDALQLAA
jgi:hypothetical protein